MTFNVLRFSYGTYLTASTNNNNVTVNRAGVYRIEGSTICGTGRRVIVNIKKNGNFINNNDGGKPWDDDSGILRAFSWSNIYKLTANDELTFFIHIIGESDNIQGIVSVSWIGDLT